jgi:hypothetical protein
MGGRVNAYPKREMHAKFNLKILKERHLGDLRTGGAIILNLIKKCACVYTGCNWLQPGLMGYL